MDATQKRRLLVVAVCALGVSALYLAPGLARSPEQVTRSPTTAPRPAGAPATSSPPATTSLGQPVSARRSDPPSTGSRSDPDLEATSAPRTTMATYRSYTSDARSAPDHSGGRDRTQPGRVTAVEVDDVTADSVTVRWAAAQDDVGVVSYRVSLNGFEVADTTDHEATIEFFHDDSTQNVVQVRAVDRAGNASATSTSVLVDRPEATSTPTTGPDVPVPPADRPTTTAASIPTTTSSTPSAAPPTSRSDESSPAQADPDVTDPTATGPRPTTRASDRQTDGGSSAPDASGEHE